MSKVIMFIGLIIAESVSLTWGSSYRLLLENGNELKTSYYWEEGDQIKFFIYGGVVGIQRKFVTKVTSSDRHAQESPTYVITDEIQSPSSSKNGEFTAVDFDRYREKKAILKEKLENALQKHREAIATKNQQAKDLTRKQYLEFSQQIIDLGNELKKANHGTLPEWWDE